MADIITDTSITPILSSDFVTDEVANTAHDELQAMMDEIQAHHNGALTHSGVLNISGNLQENSVDVPTISSVHTLTNKSLGTGTKVALGSDADGDIYYRDAGILKRLAKGANDTYLRLVAGIPSWSDTFVGIINTSNAIIASGGIQTDGATTLKIKIIDIGDWDMDATTNIDIPHGLTLANIRSASALVRHDLDTAYYALTPGNITGPTEVDGFMGLIDSTNIKLVRRAGGIFDNTGFDSTSYNRGWITITYIP